MTDRDTHPQRDTDPQHGDAEKTIPEAPAPAEHEAPRKRNPELRRARILAAAAEIIVENGPAALTHRAVAARSGESLGSTTRYFASIDELREATMEQIAAELEQELVQIEERLALGDDFVETCAEVLHEFLLDERGIRSSVAMLAAAALQPRMHLLALSWAEGFRERLAVYVGEETALAIENYFDGLTAHAALHEEPVSAQRIAAVVRALLSLEGHSR